MKRRSLILLLLALGACLHACKSSNRKKDTILQLVSEWTWRQVLAPDECLCSIAGKDTAATVCSELWSSDYKVLLYVRMDSGSCSSCKVRFSEWKPLIREADSLFGEHLNFIFVLSARSKKDLRFLLRSSAMNYPVLIDSNDEINRLNHFPSHAAYQCFLLDKDNKVLTVGNPTLNPKIWDLYKEVITGKKVVVPEKTTTVELEKAAHDFDSIATGESSIAVFRLKNTGEHPLIIRSVVTSCGCAVAAGGVAEVKLAMKPEEAGFFSKTAEVHCNAQGSPLRLTMSGMAVSSEQQ
jgi:hypothetical protein